ncbi:hypothetical protein B0H34DRAFT_193422 [Crassisporium funariophilum]|nr:hypothetical protein B0H34DRAFT_193422 [Crassisporium funariophilum]
MPVGNQSVTTWKVITTSFHVLALASTVFRILDRCIMKRLWWDDYLAFVPLVLDTIYLVLFLQGFQVNFMFSASDAFHGFVFAMFLNFSVIWSSRIILALSLARLFPPWHSARRVAFAVAILFFCLYLIVSVLFTVTCLSPGIPWYLSNPRYCKVVLGRVPISGLVAITCDLFADAALVIVPVVVLWRINLPRYQRRLILTTLSASILTLMTVIAFCVLWFSGLDIGPQTWLIKASTAHIEAAMSLIVCNLLVVVLCIYRLIHRWKTGRNASSEPAVTVDLLDISTPIRAGSMTWERRNTTGHITISSERTSAITFTDIATMESRNFPLEATSECKELDLYIVRTGLESHDDSKSSGRSVVEVT